MYWKETAEFKSTLEVKKDRIHTAKKQINDPYVNLRSFPRMQNKKIYKEIRYKNIKYNRYLSGAREGLWEQIDMTHHISGQMNKKDELPW